jgi:valine--pyruvate aminotransferase
MADISRWAKQWAKESGIGRLMQDLGEATAAGGDLLALGGGNPAHVPEVQQALREQTRLLARDPVAFAKAVGTYDPPQGNEAFIQALCGLLHDLYGWTIGPENVALTNGSQAAFFALFNLFAGTMEDGTRRRILFPMVPEYIGYGDVGLEAGMFVSARPKIASLGGPLFKYHIDFDRLPLDSSIGAICVSRPTNPSSNVLTQEELQRLSSLAAAHQIPLIVDAAYGPPFPDITFTEAKPVWDTHMILCMSLSKLGLPSVRTGIVLADRPVIERLTCINAVMGLAPGGVGPAIVTPLLRSGRIIDLCQKVIRPFYRARVERARAAIEREMHDLDFRLHVPEGAFFLWLWLPGLPIPSMELYRRLKARGVIVVPGEYFFPGLDEPWSHRQECLRISYASDPDTVDRGIHIIAEEGRRAYRRPSG